MAKELPPFLIFLSSTVFLFVSCLSAPTAASGEEYYNLGSAYFELGKFVEAERWFLKAKSMDKTRTASEYQLGRIAFETGKTEEAAIIFESLLKKDPENVLALKAAAFSRLKMGDLAAANKHYEKVVALVPESADSSYNYALVLHALNRDEDAIKILKTLLAIKGADKDALILLARSQRAMKYPEALDSYDQALSLGEDLAARREFAEVCEDQGFYARAAENYRLLIAAGGSASKNEESVQGASPARRIPGRDQFALARVLLIAGETEALTELQVALDQGFNDVDALDALVADERIGIRDEAAALIREAREARDTKGLAQDALKDE